MAQASSETTAVELMFEGDAPSASVCQAIDDAKVFVECYGNEYEEKLHSLLVRYYACHLLYTWGFANRLTAASAGDVSETRKDLDLGEKEGSSPYLLEFRKLLKEDELFTSI